MPQFPCGREGGPLGPRLSWTGDCIADPVPVLPAGAADPHFLPPLGRGCLSQDASHGASPRAAEPAPVPASVGTAWVAGRAHHGAGASKMGGARVLTLASKPWAVGRPRPPLLGQAALPAIATTRLRDPWRDTCGLPPDPGSHSPGGGPFRERAGGVEGAERLGAGREAHMVHRPTGSPGEMLPYSPCPQQGD